MTFKTQHLLALCLVGSLVSSPALAQDSIGGFFKRLVDDAKQIMSGDFDLEPKTTEPQATENSEDLVIIQDTINRALQNGATGQTFRWNNPSSGHYGSVVPLSDRLTQAGKSCRRFYRSTFTASGPAHYEGLACAASQGSWVIRQQNATGGQAAPSQTASEGHSTGPSSPVVGWSIADVRESQELLTRLGYRPGPIDGVFGPKTREAIAAFQQDQGLAPVGDPDRPAILAMRRALAESWARTDEALTKATQSSAGPKQASTGTAAPQVAAISDGNGGGESSDVNRTASLAPSDRPATTTAGPTPVAASPAMAPKARGRTALGDSGKSRPGERVSSSFDFDGIYLGMSRREFESYYPPNGQDDVFNDEYNGILLGIQYTWFVQHESGLEENVYAYFVPEQGLTSFVLWRKGIANSRLIQTFQELCATYGYKSDCDGDLSTPGRTITWKDPSFPDVVLGATSEAEAGNQGEGSLSSIRLSLSNEPAMERNRQRVANSGARRASTE